MVLPSAICPSALHIKYIYKPITCAIVVAYVVARVKCVCVCAMCIYIDDRTGSDRPRL